MAPRKVSHQYFLIMTRMRQDGILGSPGNRGSLMIYDRSVGHLDTQVAMVI